jgi:hypothetical protein
MVGFGVVAVGFIFHAIRDLFDVNNDDDTRR